MDFVQIIGYIISFLAFLYLFRKREAPQEPPESEEESRQTGKVRHSQNFQRHLEREAEMKKKRLKKMPPPPKNSQYSSEHPLKDHHLSSELEKRKIKGDVEKRQLRSSLEMRSIAPSYHNEHEENRAPSRAYQMMQRLAHRRDLIVYQEVIGKPKSLRPPS